MSPPWWPTAERKHNFLGFARKFFSAPKKIYASIQQILTGIYGLEAALRNAQNDILEIQGNIHHTLAYMTEMTEGANAKHKELEELIEILQMNLFTVLLGVPAQKISSPRGDEGNLVKFWKAANQDLNQALSYKGQELDPTYLNALRARLVQAKISRTTSMIIGNHLEGLSLFLRSAFGLREISRRSLKSIAEEAISLDKDLNTYESLLVVDPNLAALLIQLPEVMDRISLCTETNLIISVRVREGTELEGFPRDFSSINFYTADGLCFDHAYVRESLHNAGFIEVECIHTEGALYGSFEDKRLSRFVYGPIFRYVGETPFAHIPRCSNVVVKTFQAWKVPTLLDPKSHLSAAI